MKLWYLALCFSLLWWSNCNLDNTTEENSTDHKGIATESEACLQEQDGSTKEGDGSSEEGHGEEYEDQDDCPSDDTDLPNQDTPSDTDCSQFVNDCPEDVWENEHFCDGESVYTCSLTCHPDCGCFSQMVLVQDCTKVNGGGYCYSGEDYAYCCSNQPAVDECPDWIDGEYNYFCEGESLYQCRFECTMCDCAKKKEWVQDCPQGCEDFQDGQATCVD